MSQAGQAGGGGGGGGGDVVGPVSSLDNQMVVFDGLTGKIIKGALYIVDPSTANITRTVNGNSFRWGINTATTNAAVGTTLVTVNSTGTPAVGFGSTYIESIENASNAFPNSFVRTITYIDPTDTSEDVSVDYSILSAGSTTSILTYNGTGYTVKVPFITTSGRVVKARLYTDATLDENDYMVMVDTSVATHTITLPAAPQDGQRYEIGDGSGNAAAQNITIDGNGKNILAIASAATYTISTSGAVVTVTYVDDIGVWKLS